MIYWRQFKSLLLHKWYVLLAGRFVGLPLWCLIVHDWSKFLPIEFVNYSRHKSGARNVEGWARAWLHHLHHNPHHPEHWLLSWRGDPDFYNGLGESVAPFVTVLPMPETYVREMVIDMMATGKQITGSYDIAAWLNENGPRLRLHDETITRLDSVMVEIGYFLTDNCPFSYLAGAKFRKWNGQREVV